MAKSFITSHHITSIIIHILGTSNTRRNFTCVGSNYGIGTTFGTALTTIPAFRPIGKVCGIYWCAHIRFKFMKIFAYLTLRGAESTPYVALQYPVTPPFLKHLPESQVPL
jgi:hypothetical protein